MSKEDLQILLAAPRGFCAGVDRAIQIVEIALEKYGAPVYVRHEIVHNKYVVDSLKAKGAVFVKELHEIPEDSFSQNQPVIFSAHGVPKSVPSAAEARNMFYIDATCPLVSKVHREAERHHKNGDQIILIGHEGHPEVIGTIGQLPDGAVILVETVEDVERLKCHSDRSESEAGESNRDKARSPGVARDDKTINNPEALAYCTQTTLSIDDTAQVVAALQEKFPAIKGPHKEDICYATTNRQGAVKEIAAASGAMIVIGSPNSSNSNRLVEVARNYGCPKAMLVQSADDLDLAWLEGVKILGMSAGASAPDILVEQVIEAIKAARNVTVQEVAITKEDVHFKLPKVLNAA